MAKYTGGLGVEQPVECGHAIEERRHVQVATVEVPFALRKRSIRVDGVPKSASGFTESSGIEIGCEVGEEVDGFLDGVAW